MLGRRRTASPKAGILQVGTLDVQPDGGLMIDNWLFTSPAVDGVGDVGLVDGLLAGWSIPELHLIAHGSLCACPIGSSYPRR